MAFRHVVSIVAVGVVSVGGFFGIVQSQEPKPKDEMLELYGTFVDAVEQVELNYVKAVPRKKLIESALRGMLADLDPYSEYFTEAEWAQFTNKFVEGSYTGIGVSISVDPRTGRLKVLSPLPGSPAYAAGILPGDTILSIDGQATENMNLDRAFEVIQGRPGTQVTLEVLHNKAEKAETLTMSRAVIELPSVLGETRKPDNKWDFMLDKEQKLGYIRITNFIANTAADVKKALQELTAQGMKGLILDLRDDPGGLLSAAVEVSDLFLDQGKIVTTKGRNQRDKVFLAEREGTFTGIPLVVLVNQYSASASEIVAAALQDNKRAAIVGQRTFGKGSVQSTLQLNNGQSVLKLTIATYWRPSGENIHRFKDAKESDTWGVSPDKGNELKLTDAEEEARLESRRDRDLVARDTPKKPAQPPKPAPDRQMDRALELLKSKITESIRDRAA